ncbi:hypothetical protein COO60DRAFT_657512 [Scenedesmus sp. NREL 46B-D3]|nr:hypothetical protein COO60DRAFT_657512 [Scenedesmus sp. NREL 46B-D3]
MAQAAGGQRNDAHFTSQQYWAAACAAAHGDPMAKSNAAAKLLPVLANLCKQYHTHGEDEPLMATAALAAEVAQAGWDRQSREQLYDTLGAAAQAASAGGRFTLAEQLKGLQGKLLGTGQWQHRRQQRQLKWERGLSTSATRWPTLLLAMVYKRNAVPCSGVSCYVACHVLVNSSAERNVGWHAAVQRQHAIGLPMAVKVRREALQAEGMRLAGRAGTLEANTMGLS